MRILRAVRDGVGGRIPSGRDRKYNQGQADDKQPTDEPRSGGGDVRGISGDSGSGATNHGGGYIAKIRGADGTGEQHIDNI